LSGGAPAPPGADQIQFAAQEHDLGYRAYVAKHYEEAAVHFENAFFAAPNPAELRSAIRARRDGGELARAATLAAIGQRRFPADTQTARLAQDTIAEARLRVFEVQIASRSECNVAVDDRVVAAEKAKALRFFVAPGKHELVVTWADGRSARVAIDATAGGSQSLQLDPPAPPAPPPAAAPPAAPAPAPRQAPPQAHAAPGAKPLAPVVFFVGAGLTAVGVGLTIWSGLDAESHPGRDAVRTQCAGLGESCSAYQDGVAAQRRTNIILGATAGVAGATAVIGVFFTRWRVSPMIGVDEVGLRATF
jgi:hypothetical protein